MKIMLSLLFFFAINFSIYGEIPADLSFMVIDLKYSREEGVKICEIQNGTGSIFKGCQFLTGDKEFVACAFCDYLEKYLGTNIWVCTPGMSNFMLPTFKKRAGWHVGHTFTHFYGVNALPAEANRRPSDPYDLQSYAGILLNHFAAFDWERFCVEKPGMLLLNRPFYKYFGRLTYADKAIMNTIFSGDPRTEKLRPEWNAYPKGCSEELISTILEQILTQRLVIKPCRSFGGNGVIILEREELGETLATLFGGEANLGANPDKGYRHWEKDRANHFIVEAFYPSDLVQAPHLGGGWYEPTMRVVVTMAYHKKNVEIEFLYANWQLPPKSIEEGGTLNELCKNYSFSDDYFLDVSQETLKEVELELREGLDVLYRKLLND